MHRLQGALSDMRQGTRVTDRKSGAERVETIIREDEIVMVLNCNSVVPDKGKKSVDRLTWNVVFDEVREYFSKETSKATLTHANKIFYLGIVKAVYDKATANGPLLKWTTVLDFFNRSLQTDQILAALGVELIGFLETFLQNKAYRSFIDGKSWNEIIHTLLRCRAKLDKKQLKLGQVLRCLKLCISRASEFEVAVPYLRAKVVEFYAKVVQNDNSQEGDFSGVRDNVTVYLEGLTELCCQNANEFRGILCTLGEVVVPKILQIHSFKEDELVALVEFLLVQYALHMPYDCDLNSEAFYAGDVAAWKEILKLVYSFCTEIIEEKGRRAKPNDTKLTQRFLLLAAKCTRQIHCPLMADNENDEYDEMGMQAKKKMRYKTFHTIVSEMSRKPVGEELIIWMQYFSQVLGSFPEMIENKSNLSSLLHFGKSFFNTSYMLCPEFFEFFSSLLTAEKYLSKKHGLEGWSEDWFTLWDLTVRSISVCRKGKPEAINLLRKMLKEIRPVNIASLLMLYVNGTMPVMKGSVELLAEYLSLTTLPMQLKDVNIASQSALLDDVMSYSKCPRSSLMRWVLQVLNIEEAADLNTLVATLICSLVVKQTDFIINQEVHAVPEKVNVCKNFETKLLALSFTKENDFITKETATIKKTANFQGNDLIFLTNIAERLADTLQTDYEDTRNGNTYLAHTSVLNRVTLYVNVLNLLEKYEIGERTPSGLRLVLEGAFDRGMNECNQFIMDQLNAPNAARDPKFVSNVLHRFRRLLGKDNLGDKVRVLIKNKVSIQVVELAKLVFRSHLPHYIRGAINNNNVGAIAIYFDENLEYNVRILTSERFDRPEELYLVTTPLQSYEKMSLTALEFLLDYGLLCQQKLDIFVELLKDLLQERALCANLYLFDAIYLLISRVAKITNRSAIQDILSPVMELIQKMCRSYYMNSDCCLKMWNLFRDLTPHVACREGIHRHQFMILFGTAFKLLREKSDKFDKNPKSLLKVVFEALSVLAQNDPDLSWSAFSANRDTTIWILDDVYHYIANKCHEIRQAASEMICAMYESASPFDYTQGVILDSQDADLENNATLVYQERRKRFLEKVCDALETLFDVDSNLSDEELAEESVNRTNLILTCLARLIFAFAYTQKQTVMQLIAIVYVKEIDINLVTRALAYVSPNAHQTLCSHLSYVLKRIIRLNLYNFDQLPHQFFGSGLRKDFFKKFQHEITVEYFEHNRMEELKKIADEAGFTLQSLVKNSVGMIMARLIPGLAQQQYQLPDARLKLEKCNEVYGRLSIILGGEDARSELIGASIGDIMLNLISLIFEPSIVTKWQCVDIKLAEPVPPYYSEETVGKCLQYLKDTSIQARLSIIGTLASTSHASVYKILLHLSVRIHEAHNLLEKFWRLHHFSFLVKILLEEPRDTFDLMKEYVCSFTFNSYLRILALESGGKTAEESTQFNKVILQLLTTTVHRVAEDQPLEMSVHFIRLVRGIVAKTVLDPSLLPHSKPILDYLIIEKEDTFASQIICLDPFPLSIAAFSEYNKVHQKLKYGARMVEEWSLAKELEHLLKGSEADMEPTRERLVFLRELLSQRKRDLERLVKNLESRRFSDECEDDPLHRIIQMLTTLSVTSNDEVLAKEACKCLGEIGPVDLSILVLPHCKRHGRLVRNDGREAETIILETLIRYLGSTDIRLVTVAGKVLRSYLSYREPSNAAASKYFDPRLRKLLNPFFSKQQTNSVEKVEVNTLENKLALNEMDEQISYKSWITQLTVGVIESFKKDASMLSTLLPICHLRLDFCEEIFPYVIYMCLQGGRSNPIVKKIMSNYFRGFFNKFISNFQAANDVLRCVTPSSSGSSTTVIYMNKLALRSMIRVTQFLRRHKIPQEGSKKTTPFDNNFWIDLNYLDVARAAQYCGAYLTSILCVEIAATELDRTGVEVVDEEDGHENFFSQGTVVYPKNRTEAMRMEKLLLNAYSKIGEVDAVFGCGSARLLDGVVHHLDQNMDGQKLLTVANGSSINKDSCSDYLVAQAMNYLGIHNVLWTFLKGAERQGGLAEDLQQAQYECGWRLSQWDINTNNPAYIKDFSEVPIQAAFQMSLYNGVQALTVQDKQCHSTAISNGYRSVHSDLCHATLESSTNLYDFLSRLQMLRVVEDAWASKDFNEMDIRQFISKWKQQDRIPVADYKYQEPTLFLRNVILRVQDSIKPDMSLESEVIESLLTLSTKAREASQLNYADGCTQALASFCKQPLLAREFEVAKNLWARGGGETRELNHMRQDALKIMSQLIRKSPLDDDLYPSLLLKYGEWLSESHCERPNVILEKYMLKACSLFEKRMVLANGTLTDVSNAHIVVAKYADAQFQNVTKYISSEVFQLKVKHVQKAEADKRELACMDRQDQKAAQLMFRHSNNDTDEIDAIYHQQKKFLQLALSNYLKGLRTSNDHDLLIFRAISLWLENGNGSGDEQLTNETTQIFSDEELPSYKYVVVLHQLSARLNNKATLTNDTLRSILSKCAEEHPYHTLPVLLTQASLHKDEHLPIKKSSSTVQLACRVEAAEKIVKNLKRNSRLAPLVTRMEVMWLALIQLANITEKGNQDGIKKSIPSSIMKSLENLETIPVPTSNIPVLPSMNYKDHAVAIAVFAPEYGLVGGINSPKKIRCKGKNGVTYNMLLKGQDDLRQDAVMQQVFGVMNKLLQAEPTTNVRRLYIRTYKVIPLSQRTGLIEWVENTTTLGEYLVGGKPADGAHVRYRPNDYSPLECRRKLIEARAKDAEAKYSAYMTICENFKPVFRHFFFENFTEAGCFFERRLAYTRSVATNSIVGYILGLGDRHVLNILVDKTTAELIHIDLGVAFEQGRILPTPETIPFRLSRDIIDGMGISGPEGVFRRCAEMTMEVLRNNMEIILTVLQVLLYDPLYMWTLSSDRVARVQPSDSKAGRKSKNLDEPAEESANERNNAASRVLLRLRQKLMGIEEEGGQTGAISAGATINVAGHVSLLISRAVDPEKLCKLFPGWQPYL